MNVDMFLDNVDDVIVVTMPLNVVTLSAIAAFVVAILMFLLKRPI